MLKKLAFFIAFLSCGIAVAGTVTVSAAVSLKESLTEIAADYHAGGGDDIDLNFGASGTLAAQIRSGAPVDVFISAAPEPMQALVKGGFVDGSTVSTVARNELVLIAPADAKDSPSSFADLLNDSVHHVAVGEPAVVPAGQYAMQTLAWMKLTPAIQPKLVMGENVRQVLAYVIRGEADAGLVYATDAKAAGDAAVRVVAIAPAESHEPIIYPAGLIKGGHEADAQKFLDYLHGPKAEAILKAHGFSSAVAASQPAQAQ